MKPMPDELVKLRDELVELHFKKVMTHMTKDELEYYLSDHTRSLTMIGIKTGFNACYEAMSKTHVPKEEVERYLRHIKNSLSGPRGEDYGLCGIYEYVRDVLKYLTESK